MSEQPVLTVIGAGSWGTALAKLAADQGIVTRLWAREPEVVAGIGADRRNPMFLADVDLPRELAVTSDLDDALADADIVMNVVPTQHIRSALSGRGDALRRAQVVVTASKGIEEDTLLLPHEILGELGAAPEQIVAISGPSFAAEVAAGLPTAVVAAGIDDERTHLVRDLISTPTFRVYSARDIGSVELAGALKNVVAIAAGIADGLHFGHNTRAAIITRGLAEITRLGVARGGEPATFAGLAGMGDLVLTCTGGLSRNRRVGVALGEGRRLDEIVAEMHEVAEGVPTSRSAYELGRRSGVELPITEQVYATLYEHKDPGAAVVELSRRHLRDEPEPRP